MQLKKVKKQIIKVSVILFGIVLILGIIHSMVLPQQTKCHLIGFYDFKKDGNLYYRQDVSKKVIKSLKGLINQAEARVNDFWDGKMSQPTFIYCDSKEDYKRFGSLYETPACAHMEIASYVIINKSGLHLDIIAHELNHTELYVRIGHIKRELEIPIWFDEGLAMQVDFRDSYSTESLKQLSNNFANLPDIKKMNTYYQFGSGAEENVHLNYATAKYEVQNWHTDEKLKNFIKNIQSGMSFNEAYKK